MENRDIIEKASMTLADLASGGMMNTQQFQTFYQKIIDAPTILNTSRSVQMTSDSMKIEKIGFGQRIMHAGQEGVELTDAQRAKPTTGTVQLNAKEVIAEVNITYDTLENNIQKDNLRDTIMTMIADRAALDLEELAVLGDTLSADTYLKLLDGIRKQALSGGHVVDYAEAALAKEAFLKGYDAVPTKYLRNPVDWRFFTSNTGELMWKDQVAARQTALGDLALQGGSATAYGIPVKGLAMLPPYAGTGTNRVNDILLTHPRNVVFGMSRNVRVEVDKDIRARKFIIVLTAKIDAKFEEPDAVSIVQKVKA